LKDSKLKYQAQEIDALCDRPAVQDLRALTRAILHRGDRVAWLAILRAPWCGMPLDDLMLLCSDNQATIWDLIQSVHGQNRLSDAMNQDSWLRLSRFREIMAQTLRLKGRLPLHRLVESAWLALGGAASAEPSDLIDAEQFLNLLRTYEKAGDLERLDILDDHLKQLFACSDTDAAHTVQIMTIHKAKGLEFDTVIIPGLGRPPRSGSRALLRWQELPDDHLLLAPVPAFNDRGDDCTYTAIGRLIGEKETLETLRLFYVGATRAKSRLHLFGHVQTKEDGCHTASHGSLLEASWPALKNQVSEIVQADVSCAEQDEPKVQAYSRLPADWTPQPLAKSVTNKIQSSRSATSTVSETLDRKLSLSLRSEDSKAVGNLTHGWLERMAKDGLGQWSQTKIRGLRPTIRAQLSACGIPGMKVSACSKKILTALLNTFQSQRGRWILGPHLQAESELPLSGVIDGQLIHAILDRTFLTNAGERWIVDFKISEPGEHDKRDFVSNELALYSDQMQVYRMLYHQLEPHSEIRTALYFPLLDVFEEYSN
ncbi:MAG: hypothetical protein JRD88_05515, partial [Deltaproteobacteria bacterium]|nr:hypothetical protein [Deltaproteobacteria bacterium]